MSVPSKQKFVDDHFHVVFGLVMELWLGSRADAISNHELSRKITMLREKLAVELRTIYDELIPPNTPPAPKPPPTTAPPATPPAGPQRPTNGAPPGGR